MAGPMSGGLLWSVVWGAAVLSLPTAPAQPLFFVEKDPQVRVLAWENGTVSVRYQPPPPFTDISALAADALQGLYLCLVTNAGDGQIWHVSSGGAATALTPLLAPAPYGLHLAADGDLYYVQQYDEIYRIDPSGVGHLVYNNFPSSIGTVTLDAFGTVFFTCESTPGMGLTLILKLEILGIETPTVVHGGGVPGPGGLGGVSCDPCGGFFFEERTSGGGDLYQLTPQGRNFVHSVLYPECFGRSHVSDGQGTVFAIVQGRLFAPAVASRLVALSGGLEVTLHQTSPAGVITALAWTPPPCPQPSAATGSVGATAGGPYDVLTVNESAGGSFRCAEVGVGERLVVSLASPPTAGVPPLFTLFGRVGSADPTQGLTGPGDFGSLAIDPCSLLPSHPALFTLVDGLGLGGCAPAFPSAPAPWSVTVPGAPFWFTFTLQGIVQDRTAEPWGWSTTNALRIVIR